MAGQREVAMLSHADSETLERASVRPAAELLRAASGPGPPSNSIVRKPHPITINSPDGEDSKYMHSIYYGSGSVAP